MNKQIRQMMQQAQRMQQAMARVREELAEEKLEGHSGGGAVRATVNGHGDLLGISISPEVMTPEDSEMLEDLVVAAVRDAVEKSRELSREKLRESTGIPGMEGLL